MKSVSLQHLALALLLLSSRLASSAPVENSLIPNGGFEEGVGQWKIYIPEEAREKNCQFEVTPESLHSGANGARLQADDFARFSIGFGLIPVQAGERYRVSVWVRGESNAHVRLKSPGFVVRLSLRQGEADADGGHLFIGLGNRVTRNLPADPLAPSLPTEWTQVEAVVEIPSGVDAVGPALFSWGTKGGISVDDFSLEKVDATTPPTPLWEGSGSGASSSPAQKGPVTTDRDLLATLNLDAPGMEKVKAAASQDPIDWPTLQAAYLEYRRTASPARWRIMPEDKPSQPKAKSDPWADGVLAHHIRNGYHFQPTEADMGKDFKWTFNPVPRNTPAYTDEWTYCAISRTEFWETLASAYWQTGNEKYAAGWVDQLTDFAVKNPMHFDPVPGTPSLWRSLDSALRISISWPDAYYHFLQSPSFTPEANWLYLKLNYEHAQLLGHWLQDQSRSGNWVATECAGLFTVGTLFPEFRDATTWRQQAIDRLGVELERMVPPDGFEAELTPTYHFVALDGFRKPVELAKLNQIPLPESFRTRIMSMYRAAVLVMDQRGYDVQTNDSSPVNAALQAEAGLRLGDDPLLAWAASHGQKGIAPPVSTALPYAGFYAMRGGWKRDDLFLFFRGGPTGIGHQHEDMLEVVLRAWNKTLLFDPGTYPYDQSNWRRFANGTASHNTIIVDGKWQHRGANKPPVSQPTGNPWVTTPLFDYVSATYDAGYQESVYRPRPFDPQSWKGTPDKSVSHTRRVLYLRPGYALVLDTLDGTGSHTFDAHFHLDAPAAKLDPKTHAAFTQNKEGTQLALYPLELENLAADIVQGQKDPLLGWMPLEHRAIPTVRFRKQQEAPAIFATFLYPYRDQPPVFSSAPLEVQGEGLWSRCLKTSGETAEIVLAKNGKVTPFTVKSPLLGEVTTEAVGLIVRQPGNKGTPYLGGIDLRSYRDERMEWIVDQPISLVFALPTKTTLLCFNPGDAAVTLDVKLPFARKVMLPPQAWTTVTAEGESVATPPVLFPPLDPSASGLAYADYLKGFPDSPVASGEAVRIKGESMTLPEKAALVVKTGADGKVLGRWDGIGTVTTAHVEVPQTGWYRLKIRYCSGEEPLRSLLINGKAPFAEAEEFSLPSTIGAAPSDGWSNLRDDWNVLEPGAGPASPGWKLHLERGPCTLELRNDGGGLNLDWLELVPSP